LIPAIITFRSPEILLAVTATSCPWELYINPVGTNTFAVYKSTFHLDIADSNHMGIAKHMAKASSSMWMSSL